MEFEWYVFINDDFNGKGIGKFNVFNSVKFKRGLLDIKKRLKKNPSLDCKSEIEKELMYCFWGKCEYEVVIGSLFSKDISDFDKIDIYDQVMLNFDKFAEYVIGVLPKLKEKSITNDTNKNIKSKKCVKFTKNEQNENKN